MTGTVRPFHGSTPHLVDKQLGPLLAGTAADAALLAAICAVYTRCGRSVHHVAHKGAHVGVAAEGGPWDGYDDVARELGGR